MTNHIADAGKKVCPKCGTQKLNYEDNRLAEIEIAVTLKEEK